MPPAYFALSQAVANRCFIPNRAGNIIIVASARRCASSMQMKAVPYYASKAAALQLTPRSPVEWGPLRHSSECHLSGIFPVEDVGRALLEKIEADVIARTPLGRLGGDTDLQGAAVYLASDASRHVTGQYIAVDGGASNA
jgi:NAD(P)-dependent dehydrogenase (short-subunit alcohol dehydrogenase family)